MTLIVQWLNLLFFLLPNAESVGPSCYGLLRSRRVGKPNEIRWSQGLFLLFCMLNQRMGLPPDLLVGVTFTQNCCPCSLLCFGKVDSLEHLVFLLPRQRPQLLFCLER